MIIKTKGGNEYRVDLDQKKLVGLTEVLDYHLITGAFVGSQLVEFWDEDGDPLFQIKSQVIEITGPPQAAPEAGNLIVHTQNSSYEFKRGDKQFRRLVGLNAATRLSGKDGEWKPYEQLHEAVVGRRPFITFTGHTRALCMSECRAIEET